MTKGNYLKYLKHPVLICFILSGIINFIIECFGRKSILNAWIYLKEQPLVFFYNLILILITMSVTLLIKRRHFGVFVISLVWLALGITNGVLLSFRTTPFTAIDLLELKAAKTIFKKYFTGNQIIYLIIGSTVLIGLLMLVFFLTPKHKGKLNYKKNILYVILCIMFLYGLTKTCLAEGILSRKFGNLAFSYNDYGVPYCYVVTMLDTGIKMPMNYSKTTIRNILNSETKNKKSPIAVDPSKESSQPNIVFVQLESFFDPTWLKGLSFSEDPIPNFRRLSKEFSSGYLKVPVVGAGTCNTEFEVITGMNLDFFGPGEYPYKTILNKTTSENISFDLKKLDYETHAIHDNDGTFYSRNKIFSQFGFDTFTSIEYMENVELNKKGWAKDKVLTEEIMKALNASDKKDLVYTIAVQSHGKYPTTKIDDTQTITVNGIEDKELLNAYEYYVNQIHEVDSFVNDLTNALSAYDEDVILVLYGDHLPTLGIQANELKNKTVYETPYVIWDNFGLKKNDATLQAYQLSSAALSRVGIQEGTLTKYHQNKMGTRNYLKNLKLLQYDMLYGKRYVYGGKNPFEASDLVMGISEVTINKVEDIDNALYVSGDNFTEFSHVLVNGKKQKTVFVSTNLLKVEDCKIETDDIVTVMQSGNDHKILSKSKEFEYQ